MVNKVWWDRSLARWASWLIALVMLVVMVAGCAPSESTAKPIEPITPPAESSCCPGTSTPTSTTAEPPPIPMVSPSSLPVPALGHSRGYLTTPQELLAVRRKADQGLDPYASAVAAELAYAQDAYRAGELTVPSLIDIQDREVESPEFLYLGSRRAYALAVAYHLLRGSDPGLAEQYAQRAYELVMAMPRRHTEVSGYQANTRLNLSLTMQTFVYAADLLADWPVPGAQRAFWDSPDNQQFKEWLGRVIFRYPYNAAHTEANNWGNWARVTTAVIGDYVGNDAPLYAQQFEVGAQGEYVVDPNDLCLAGGVSNCVAVTGAEAYAAALRLHFQYVDGKMVQVSRYSCDSKGSKSMIRPDGGLPDELRRQYTCDAATIADPTGAAARYSQHATEAMIVLAEIAWRRGSTDVYTHIDPVTQRGAVYRSLLFLLRNQIDFSHSSVLEIANRFYTFQAKMETDPAKRAEFQALANANLPRILKRQGNWPTGVAWISFGTLTHGFAPGELITPPPTVAPRG
jgi:alginate lyase